MLEFNTKIKKWGNSYGLVIPKNQMDINNIKPEEEIHVIAIKKNELVKETFGLLKGWKLTGQKAKDMIRKELHNA